MSSIRSIGCSLLLALSTACGGAKQAATPSGASGGSISDLMKARNLSENDVAAALKTYTPSGRHDEYYRFASGGHSGQIVVIGLPSMRILKYIAVFTPEPWQGYGYGDDNQKQMFKDGERDGHALTWADTHHPALSET